MISKAVAFNVITMTTGILLVGVTMGVTEMVDIEIRVPDVEEVVDAEKVMSGTEDGEGVNSDEDIEEKVISGRVDGKDVNSDEDIEEKGGMDGEGVISDEDIEEKVISGDVDGEGVKIDKVSKDESMTDGKSIINKK